MPMQFIPGVRRVLSRAWSPRLMELAAVVAIMA